MVIGRRPKQHDQEALCLDRLVLGFSQYVQNLLVMILSYLHNVFLCIYKNIPSLNIKRPFANLLKVISTLEFVGILQKKKICI
jgi:hypothetical protein